MKIVRGCEERNRNQSETVANIEFPNGLTIPFGNRHEAQLLVEWCGIFSTWRPNARGTAMMHRSNRLTLKTRRLAPKVADPLAALVRGNMMLTATSGALNRLRSSGSSNVSLSWSMTKEQLALTVWSDEKLWQQLGGLEEWQQIANLEVSNCHEHVFRCIFIVVYWMYFIFQTCL
jgi:hypothetical protein